MSATVETTHLKDLWSQEKAAALKGDPLALLTYRSNLLGADLRITNFGGGNTSSKFDLPDPFTSEPTPVLAVKGSGGDLGSIQKSGFALLYMHRLKQLSLLYRGEEQEDEMVNFYPLSAFGENRVAASIDTPLHAFLPFPHVDHLHPDSAIAIAASATGKRKLEEFNRKFGRQIIWLPWQRPGFELAVQLEKAVKDNPECDGVLLGSHGLFTWGDTQRECYQNSLRTIDAMSEFVAEHEAKRKTASFGGVAHQALGDRHSIAARILPSLRGLVSSSRRVIAHFTDHEDALRFAGSAWARELGKLGTSCPDHFLRTRICPLFIDWQPDANSVDHLKGEIAKQVGPYRDEYAAYYNAWATTDSPKLRDANPSIVIVPGVGLFGFGKNKKEARITTEFFINAIHVMDGANALDGGDPPEALPQARTSAASQQFASFRNYVALPRSEAFRIEYWALEEAKLQRMPAEAEFSRKILLVIGAGSGIGREVALLLARKGAHLVLADMNAEAAKSVNEEVAAIASPDSVRHVKMDLSSPESISGAAREAILQFGGIDGVINTAAIFPVSTSSKELSDAQWDTTFRVNVTGNYFLARELRWIFQEQKLTASMVLTSSANAVVSKFGSEAYDTSKAALSHLIRELALKLGPTVRVNGIAPATVVSGSTMFPRDRVIQSLTKYKIEYSESDSTEVLREKLAGFYAERTITHRPILPQDCAEAIAWLAGDKSAKTTGHIIPVDGGLAEAFLR